MSTQDATDLTEQLISIFSDEEYSQDASMLLATDEDRFVPCELISKKLKQTEEAVQIAAHKTGILEVNEDGSRIRATAKMAIKYMKRARKTVAASFKSAAETQQPDDAKPTSSGMSEEEKEQIILKQAEYYFGDDNLPYDYLSLREFDRTGTFPLSWITTAPKLKKLKVTDEDVVKALSSSKKLLVKDDRVALKEDFTPAIRSIALRTLQTGKSLHPSPFTIEDAKKLHAKGGGKGKQKGKGKGKGAKNHR
eukprot:TRINITY_DN18983_c0_g1_i1.p1 TRINITY_DN18983_c0_g1~~TRINITY_DN18983_c0_g1_i1.p1  ORF type:complete len:251 (+),score=45.15 TRINITY_DN18983_c0_g1_i1:140-892(+)